MKEFLPKFDFTVTMRPTLSVTNSFYKMRYYTLRYYAICKPMVAQGRCTIPRAKKIIVLLWLMALLISIPLGYEQVKP